MRYTFIAKRVFTWKILLLLSFAISCLSASAWQYQETTYELPYEEGMGTEDNPYIIKTEQQLADLSYYVNWGSSFEGAYFALGNDLDLNPGIVFNSDGTYIGEGTPQEWVPIGYKDTPFKGNFDGRGHTIRGVYLSSVNYGRKTAGGYNRDIYCYGTFFCQVENSSITNIHFDNSVVNLMLPTSQEYSDWSNYYIIGGVVGNYTLSMEKKCQIDNIINNTNVIIHKDIYNKTALDGENVDFYIGGIIGSVANRNNYSSISVKDCTNNGNISLEADSGNVYGNIGGIVSSASPVYEFSCCINNGNITSKGGYKIVASGIANYINSDADICGLINTGNIISNVSNGLVYDLRVSNALRYEKGHYYTYGLGTIYDCWNNGMIESIGTIDSDVSIYNEVYEGGALFGTLYEDSIINCVNYGEVIKGNGLIGDCSSSYIMNCANYANIFGSSGIVGSAHETNFYDTYNYGNVKSDRVVGGIIGIGESCDMLRNCHNKGRIIGNVYSGGLCGKVNPYPTTIPFTFFDKCSNAGYIFSNRYSGGLIGDGVNVIMRECFNEGECGAGIYVGGIAGELFGDTVMIEKCYNIGYINVDNGYVGGLFGILDKAVVTNSYNIGEVNGLSSYEGGLVGALNRTTIRKSYNIGLVKGDTNIGCITAENLDNVFMDVFYLPIDGVSPIYGVNQMSDGIIAKTAEDFANGTVCVLLNEGQTPTPWGQEIGIDASPVLNGKGNPDKMDIDNATKDNIFPPIIYDLQGRKQSTPQRGLNIIDGKKVLVK